MKKQYAVFGLGSFGESVAITLQSLGCEVVAVDNHMERIEEIASKVSYAIKADVGDPEVIRSLGTRNLDGVVVAVADDMEASVMATLGFPKTWVSRMCLQRKRQSCMRKSCRRSGRTR